MTEYDYSPDAYERYLATQKRIARWAEDTSRHHPSNPFVTSPSEDHSTHSYTPQSSRSPERSHSKSSHRSASDTAHQRPHPSRSYTAPVPSQRSVAEGSSRSRSTHHSRGTSRSSTSRRTSGSSHSHATTSSFKTVTPNANGPTHVKRSRSQSILVPIDGGRYVIIPARGTRLEVMDHPEAAPPKGTKSEKPLLKRLFSSFS